MREGLNLAVAGLSGILALESADSFGLSMCSFKGPWVVASCILGQDTVPLLELAPGRRSQHRQHEVITPVGISCPLNTDWRRAPPPTLSCGLPASPNPSAVCCQAEPGPALWASSALWTPWTWGSVRHQSQQSGQVGVGASPHKPRASFPGQQRPHCVPSHFSLPRCSAELVVEPGSLRHVDDKVPEGPP